MENYWICHYDVIDYFKIILLDRIRKGELTVEEVEAALIPKDKVKHESLQRV